MLNSIQWKCSNEISSFYEYFVEMFRWDTWHMQKPFPFAKLFFLVENGNRILSFQVTYLLHSKRAIVKEDFCCSEASLFCTEKYSECATGRLKSEIKVVLDWRAKLDAGDVVGNQKKKKKNKKKEKTASKKFTRNVYSFETNEIICIRRTLRCSLYSTYILDRFVRFGENFSIKAPCIDGSDTTEAHLGHHIQKNRLQLMKNPTAEHLSTC